jgi:hypothetical protein
VSRWAVERLRAKLLLSRGETRRGLANAGGRERAVGRLLPQPPPFAAFTEPGLRRDLACRGSRRRVTVSRGSSTRGDTPSSQGVAQTFVNGQSQSRQRGASPGAAVCDGVENYEGLLKWYRSNTWPRSIGILNVSECGPPRLAGREEHSRGTKFADTRRVGIVWSRS